MFSMSLMVLTQSVDSRGPYFFKKLNFFIKGDIGGLIFFINRPYAFFFMKGGYFFINKQVSALITKNRDLWLTLSVDLSGLGLTWVQASG